MTTEPAQIDLILELQRGFNDDLELFRKRFDVLEARVEHLDLGLNGRIDALVTRIDSMDQRLQQVEGRMERLEEMVLFIAQKHGWQRLQDLGAGGGS
ncbi:MAG: hypothetical protein F4060_02420 [Holophagales bacterium]|nr:hypothetical protein [Holophagales bacterium]MYG30084.1 hypothetical protein [Holophagales bacterium]MYI78772.1 hypothetical protein [Holophagales bacterium]